MKEDDIQQPQIQPQIQQDNQDVSINTNRIERRGLNTSTINK